MEKSQQVRLDRLEREKIAARCAANDPSDPFVFDRVMAQLRAGSFDGGQLGNAGD